MNPSRSIILDDLTLANRLADNLPGAAENLVEAHYDAIYRFLRQLTRRNEDAEDLVQETILRAIRGAASYDGRAPLRSWLFAIAFREFTKWRRIRPWLPLLGDRAVEAAGFDAVIEAEILLSALARLSAKSQAAFLLHYVEDLSIDEIASVLNIPPGTAKSRLSAARERLRHLLENEETPYVPETCGS